MAGSTYVGWKKPRREEQSTGWLVSSRPASPATTNPLSDPTLMALRQQLRDGILEQAGLPPESPAQPQTDEESSDNWESAT